MMIIEDLNSGKIPNNEFTQKLVENFDIFFEIMKEISGRTEGWQPDLNWIGGCGSYLFNGGHYDYHNGFYAKQQLLYDTAKNSKNVLEIGTYLGHSLFIMLLANPHLNVTTIDIDNRFSLPATNLLKRRFPNAKINFIHNNSIDALNTIDLATKFDLFHIDGDHDDKLVNSEFELCSKFNLGNIMNVVFDDLQTCTNTVSHLENKYKILEKIVPGCDWTNCYLKIDLNIN